MKYIRPKRDTESNIYERKIKGIVQLTRFSRYLNKPRLSWVGHVWRAENRLVQEVTM